MVRNIVTVGTLLDSGLIKKETKVKISADNLMEINLIKPLIKKKVVEITELDEKGWIKKKGGK
ncbi:hypothetical protein HOE04_03060 [archaeon]|jgi:hypothetical protein|nr:hypothetical protein [archaeon]